MQYSRTHPVLVQADIDLGHQLSADRVVVNNGAIFVIENRIVQDLKGDTVSYRICNYLNAIDKRRAFAYRTDYPYIAEKSYASKDLEYKTDGNITIDGADPKLMGDGI